MLGLFACGFDGELRDAETTLRGLRSEVARAALEASAVNEGKGEGDGGGGGVDDFILLAIDRATKRLTCRRGTNLARTEVGDCGERLKNFVTVEAKYDLDVSVAVRGDLRSSVERALVGEQRRIMRSSVVVDGEVIDPECAVVVADRGWRSDGRAEFLCAPRCEATKEVDDANNEDDDGGDDGVPVVRIAGTVHARAVVYSRDSCGRAASELARDAARSIAARWHALLDSADDAALENDETTKASSPLSTGFTPSSSSVVIHLPQRVFIPWIENAPASDYVEETETESDVFARVHQIFAIDRLQPDAIQRVERPSRASASSSSNRHQHAKMSTAGAGSVTASQPPKLLSVCVVAAFAILIAVLISHRIIPPPP